MWCAPNFTERAMDSYRTLNFPNIQKLMCACIIIYFFLQKRLSTGSGSALPEDTPVAAKRAKNANWKESAGGRGSHGRQRRKSGRRMSFGGLRRAVAG